MKRRGAVTKRWLRETWDAYRTLFGPGYEVRAAAAIRRQLGLDEPVDLEGVDLPFGRMVDS